MVDVSIQLFLRVRGGRKHVYARTYARVFALPTPIDDHERTNAPTPSFLARPLFRLSLGATHFFYQLVPPLEDRTRVTWRNFPYTIAFLVPMLFMAYLARRPGTKLIRMLMLPSAIAVTLRSTYGYVWVGRGFHVYNWGEGEVFLKNFLVA